MKHVFFLVASVIIAMMVVPFAEAKENVSVMVAVAATGKKPPSIKGEPSGPAAKPSNKKVVDLTSMTTWQKHTKKGVVTAPRMVSDFYATNLGLPHVKDGIPMPKNVMVSFDENMIAFWQKKANRDSARNEVVEGIPKILKRYLGTDRGLTTLPLFIKHVDMVVAKAKKGLDWKPLCDQYDLSLLECSTLQEVVRHLRGKDFVAYGITELLPEESSLNVPYLDMLLQNAGASYLMHFPALHDDTMSLGFYQHTKGAVCNEGKRIEGASMVNRFLKVGGYKIPDTVIDLVGDDHHVAAFYFAVHNFAMMLQKMPAAAVKLLAHKHKAFQDQMVMYAAAAHHLPAPAKSGFIRWVKGGMKKPLESYYTEGTRKYAIKTHNNLVALYEKYPN